MKSIDRFLRRFALMAATILSSQLIAQSPRLLPFQARLSEATGQPVPDGPRVVQFQIFGEPTGGAALWAGETHRVTINGGLVNVMLGTKNPLPSDRPDDASRSFFDATLYLQITVDANGDGKFTEADPPLLPRQALVAVLFAAEASNARKLLGHDWTALFGSNNPEAGFLLPTKIQEGALPSTKLVPHSISALQLAAGSVGTAELGNDAVTTTTILDGAVTGAKLAPDSVATGNLQDQSVTLTKLANRQVGANVPLGGVAISGSSGDFSASTKNQDVPGLSVTITTSGRPVFIGLIADGNTTKPSYVGTDSFGPVHGSGADFAFTRDSDRICLSTVNSSPVYGIYTPPGSFYHLDIPPAGTHTYTFRAVYTGSQVQYVRLVAYEL